MRADVGQKLIGWLKKTGGLLDLAKNGAPFTSEEVEAVILVNRSGKEAEEKGTTDTTMRTVNTSSLNNEDLLKEAKFIKTG